MGHRNSAQISLTHLVGWRNHWGELIISAPIDHTQFFPFLQLCVRTHQVNLAPLGLNPLVEQLFLGDVSNSSALWAELWELDKKTCYFYELRLPRAPVCSLWCLVLVAIYASSRLLSYLTSSFFDVMGKGGFAKPGLFILTLSQEGKGGEKLGLICTGWWKSSRICVWRWWCCWARATGAIRTWADKGA